MYGLIDKSVLEVILSTCKSTEIPPKPSKNAVNIMFIESFLQATSEILFIPFVISKMPQRRGLIKEVSICRMLNSGEIQVERIFIIPLDFKIEITLENITTNPPINKIVEILLVILSANTSPKLEKETVLFSRLKLELELSKFLFFFQNLNIIPTLIPAKI